MQRPNREELRAKLRQKIGVKRAFRDGSAKKGLDEAKDILRRMDRDTRVSTDMVQMYRRAIEEFPTNDIPSPMDILDDPQRFKAEHEAFLHSLMTKCKAGQLEASEVKTLMDNAYHRYMTHVLGVPLLPGGA